jgi:hypothetical protein
MTARMKAVQRPRKTAAAPRHPPLQNPRAEVPADLVADGVADDRRDDDHDEHAGEGDVTELGRGPGEQGHRLAGHDEPDEDRVLGEDDQAGDEQDQPAGQLEDAVDQATHAAKVSTADGSRAAGRVPGTGKACGNPGRARSQPVPAAPAITG